MMEGNSSRKTPSFWVSWRVPYVYFYLALVPCRPHWPISAVPSGLALCIQWPFPWAYCALFVALAESISLYPKAASKRLQRAALTAVLFASSGNCFPSFRAIALQQLQHVHAFSHGRSFLKTSLGLRPLESFFTTVRLDISMVPTPSFKKSESQLWDEVGRK